jgi:hypothetical protein
MDSRARRSPATSVNPVARARADLDLVRSRLAPDLGAPRLDVLEVLDFVDHLAVCQQLSVVVAAVDTRDQVVDASPDENGIVHALLRDDDARPAPAAPALTCPKGAEKARKGPWEHLADLTSNDAAHRNRCFAGLSWMARPGLEPGTPRFSVVTS